MKFAHLADCHIGSWREPKLREVSLQAFVKAVDKCISEKVDFALVSGDLFNTSMPPLESLSLAVKKLKEMKDAGIPVYMIAGSHDFSPSQRTVLEVIFNAGLAVNAASGKEDEKGRLFLNFTADRKTGAKIAGMIGKKGGLEKSYYESLAREHLEKEEGYKIFMFHTAITELKPKEMAEMDSAPVSLLPRNFNYYAGGHVHVIDKAEIEGYGTIVYPGPIFPNSFSELEKLQNGGFYIVEDGKARYEPIVIHPVHSISINCDNKTPEEVEQEACAEANNREFLNTIVTIRLAGRLKSGKPSDIRFRDIFQKFNDRSAYFVMKSTSRLTSAEFEEIKVEAGSAEETEERMIDEHSGKSGIFSREEEKRVIRELMRALSAEKDEGEKAADFEKRVKRDASAAVWKGGIPPEHKP